MPGGLLRSGLGERQALAAPRLAREGQIRELRLATDQQHVRLGRPGSDP